MTYPLFHWEAASEPPLVLSAEDFAASFPGEGQHVEFKQGVGRGALREAITAFSNSDGGVILIGVDDDGQPRGHELTGAAEAELHRIAGEVHDPGRYDLHSLAVGDQRVTVVAVDRRREGFAQTTDGGVLVRQGASNVRLFGSELSAFMSRRSLERFERTSTNLGVDQLDQELLEQVADVWGWSMSTHHVDRLLERDLATRTRDGIRLTVAGALYLSTSPESVLGKSFVEVFRYRDGSSAYDKRVAIRGPIHRQVEDATNFVMAELGAELVVLGLRRYELDRLPRPVLREAVANAIAHRDYQATGTAVRIEIRPDCVRVVSPGGLREPVTVMNIRETQSARNAAVIDTLRHFGLAEDAGLGVDVMQDSMSANMLQPPTFVDDGRSVTVELRIGSTVTPSERAWLLELEQRGDVLPAERMLLVHAARGSMLTNSTVRELLGIDSVAARTTLQKLRDAGFLEQTGSRGGAAYTLAGDLEPPAGLRLGPDELADLIEELALEGPITNTRVRQHTGLDRAGAVRLLGSLVKQGRLRLVGSRRGAKYVLPDDNDSMLQ